MLPGDVRLASLTALVAALAACAGNPRTTTAPGRPPIEVTVHVVGQESFDGAELADGLALAHLDDADQEWDPFLVSRDRERLIGFYLRHGFFDVEVTPRVQQRGRRVTVTFTVDEGPRARLRRVEMAGLPDDPRVSPEALRRLIELDDGEPFVYEAYDAAKPRLVAALERAGYAHARLDAKVAADKVRAEAIIRLEFDPGPPCVFGKVEVRGVSGRLADAVKDRITVREGQPYSSADLGETQTALYELGRFASVRVEPDRATRSAVVPVTITVAMAPRHELRVGGGFGLDPTAYEVRSRASYGIDGWPGALYETDVEVRPAYVFLRDDPSPQPRVEAMVQLARLDLFHPRIRGEVEVSFAYLALEAYTSVGPRLRLGLRSPLATPRLQAGVGWQLRVLDFSRIDEAVDEDTATRLGLEGPYVLGFYEQNLVADLRDDPVAPTRGIWAELRVEEGSAAAGGELEYVRLAPEVRGYVPLGSLVLAGRARWGTIIGDVPVTQRWYAGGASSQRGFPERRLSPTATNTVDGELFSAPIGGAALVELGAELRAPLGTWRKLDLGGVVFLDGADVTERSDELDVGHLHWAAGVGLRVATPVGPVRLDFGYRLNRTGPGEPLADDHFAFHLSLGEAY